MQKQKVVSKTRVLKRPRPIRKREVKAAEEEKKESNAEPAAQQTPDLASHYSLKQVKLTKNFKGLTPAEADLNIFQLAASERMVLQKKLKSKPSTKYSHHISEFLETVNWTDGTKATARKFIFLRWAISPTSGASGPSKDSLLYCLIGLTL
jgi:hypothetical protein